MFVPARHYLVIFSPLSGYPDIAETWNLTPSTTAHKLNLNTCAGGSAAYVGTRVKDGRSRCSVFFEYHTSRDSARELGRAGCGSCPGGELGWVFQEGVTMGVRGSIYLTSYDIRIASKIYSTWLTYLFNTYFLRLYACAWGGKLAYDAGLSIYTKNSIIYFQSFSIVTSSLLTLSR